MIPQNVLEVLESVRASGAVNMIDRKRVIDLAAVADESAARWLHDHPEQYMDALKEVGARLKGSSK